MMFLPGRKVVVSLTDGSAFSGITKLSWHALRLRDVTYGAKHGTADVVGRVIVAAAAILTVQVVS